MNYKIVSALVMCIAVTGCSGGKVLFNKEDPNSGFTKTKNVVFDINHSSSCKRIPLKTGHALLPGGVEVATVAASLGYSIVKTEVNHWIDGKIAAYTFPYSTMTNFAYMRHNTEISKDAPPQEMCFHFERTVYDKGATNKESEIGLSFDLSFKEFNYSQSFVAKIDNINLNRSGAITTDKQGVDLIVTAVVSTFSLKENSGAMVLTTANITIPNVPIGYKDPKLVGYSPLFKIIPYATPVTISLSITEKGHGVENYKTLQDDIKNNADAAKALLDVVIKKQYE